jgi:hypothetical protein
MLSQGESAKKSLTEKDPQGGDTLVDGAVVASAFNDNRHISSPFNGSGGLRYLTHPGSPSPS